LETGHSEWRWHGWKPATASNMAGQLAWPEGWPRGLGVWEALARQMEE